PAEAYPAVDGPRALAEEAEILRREEKDGVPGWLWGTAYVVVGGLFFGLFALVGAGYAAAGRPGPSDRTTSATRRLVDSRA
ncbi:MAG TPA: hypothetical protein VJ819_05760, partial [Nocardioidaceae bacterium]|nr:hypothetical protein [Nocardioidaceae bacterium]